MMSPPYRDMNRNLAVPNPVSTPTAVRGVRGVRGAVCEDNSFYECQYFYLAIN
jgi:hypothetical protein